MSTTTTQFTLSRTETGAMKGIAILAMLFHHIYACPPAGIEHYGHLLGMLGGLGKVCVALFVFCSAYGLSTQYHSETVKGSIHFILARLVRFYTNYWPIFIIFVPIGVFVFGHPLTASYTSFRDPIRDILAINGFQSYNITWWFNRLIILLYILFPLLYHLCRMQPIVFLVGSLVLTMVGQTYIMPYYLAFAFGILWQQKEEWLSTCVSRVPQWLLAVISMLLLLGMCWLRIEMTFRHVLLLDCFIAPVLALSVVSFLRLLPHLLQLFSFLGKHSGNIYMTHTFIYSYWFSKYVYICDLRIGGGVL